MRTILAAIYLVSALSIASLAHARPLTEQETATLRSRSVNTQSEFESRVLARRLGQELNMDAVQPLLDAKDISDLKLSVDGISPRLIAHGRNDAKIEKLLKAKGATYNPLMLAKLKAQTWMMGNGH